MPATRISTPARRLAGALLLLLGGACNASAQPDLARYVDKNRVLLVFARSTDDPSFSAQKKILAGAKAGTGDRDLVLVPALGADARDLRRQFMVAEGSFAALLIGKDAPPGRLPGPKGPLAASQAFRAAVLDLTCTVEQMIVPGDRVVTHLRFQGHFTGTFRSRHGQGENIDFIATDIYRVVDGRIAANWHIEDNLTLFKQLGVVNGP